MAIGHVSTGMGDHLSALLLSLMTLWLTLVDQNPFWLCLIYATTEVLPEVMALIVPAICFEDLLEQKNSIHF